MYSLHVRPTTFSLSKIFLIVIFNKSVESECLVSHLWLAERRSRYYSGRHYSRYNMSVCSKVTVVRALRGERDQRKYSERNGFSKKSASASTGRRESSYYRLSSSSRHNRSSHERRSSHSYRRSSLDTVTVKTSRKSATATDHNEKYKKEHSRHGTHCVLKD